ncbi:MAG: helicase C-terminal domain-containing protein [Eggerthellaceae bacterium]|jgi:ATP-dependent DNA helicase DinG
MTSKDTSSKYTLDEFVLESTCAEVRKRYASLPSAAKGNRYGILDKDVVVVDTETTGVSFRHDELIQIAAARMCDGEIVDWYITFVDPGKPIPEEIQHLTNIHPENVEGAPIPEDAVRGLAEFVGDSPLVAHNAAFDRHFITMHEEGASLRKNVWIDSLDLARIALPRMKSHRLVDLARAFGVEESTHRADDDVATTCKVFRILLAAVDAMPKDLVAAIAGMATVEEWPTAFVFEHFAEGNKTPFNLHAMRHERMKRTKHTSRSDAESIASSDEGVLEFPSDEEIESAFNPGGVLDNAYESFEPRSEQIAMSKAVTKAFRTSTNLAVEAGTGVGKSMAYLIPAVLTAKRNDITVGIATKTNNLLDQLVNKELPLLDKTMGGVTFTSLKGFSHYLCLRSVGRLLNEGPHEVETSNGPVHQAPALAGILSFIEQSEYDDIDALKVDYRAVPRYLVTTTSHECLRRKCPFFGTDCFVHGARRRAESSDIVVTNHSLLFCDLAAEGGLLPPIRYWVVDEAHGAENEGRRAFSIDLESESLIHTAQKVAGANPAKNVFLHTARKFGNNANVTAAELLDVSRETSDLSFDKLAADANGKPGEGSTALYHLVSRAMAAGKRYDHAVHEYTKHVKDLLYFDTSQRNKSYERIDLWINDDVRGTQVFKNLAAIVRELAQAIDKLISTSTEIVAYLEGMEGAAAIQQEIAALGYDLRDQLNACEVIFNQPSAAYAYAANIFRKRDRLSDTLSALMLNIGEKLNETLFANTYSVVFTSATLTIDGSFDAFATSLGLNGSEGSQTDFLELESSYDFDDQMTVYVPTDMPEPNDSHYLAKLEELLVAVHRALQGSTLSLFTNRREMETCYEVVRDELKGDDLRVVCQKWGVSIKGLRDEFLANEHLSLFALKSFWEGFDAPGSTLKAVVISKLPFKKPSDPLSCERQQLDPHAWSHYVLPEAVLETKQAAGRLIRSADDRGDLIIADHRLISRGYGKKFLRSMPSHTVKEMTIAEIAEELAGKQQDPQC